MGGPAGMAPVALFLCPPPATTSLASMQEVRLPAYQPPQLPLPPPPPPIPAPRDPLFRVNPHRLHCGGSKPLSAWTQNRQPWGVGRLLDPCKSRPVATVFDSPLGAASCVGMGWATQPRVSILPPWRGKTAQTAFAGFGRPASAWMRRQPPKHCGYNAHG